MSRAVRQEDRPDKQVYAIAPAGRKALTEWLNEAPVEPPPDKSPILLKLFFGSEADPEALLEQVGERRAAAERLRRELEEIEATKAAGDEDDFFPALTRAWGRAYATAFVAWADEVAEAIERRRRA